MIDNLKLPAYPVTVQMEDGVTGEGHQNGHTTAQMYGFTKLEKATLMIAAGMASTWLEEANAAQYKHLAGVAVDIAKAVIEEANK